MGKLSKLIKKEYKKVKKEQASSREQTINWLESGKHANQFIVDLEKYATNEKGEKIVLRDWTKEYARLIADARVAEVSITGSAQIGKSLLNALLKVWLVVECKLNALYVFAGMQALHRMVDIQFKPLYKNWLEQKGITFKPEESQNKQLIQINGGTGIFSYAGTVSRNTEGRASAGSNIISFSCDWAFCDERSQYVAGASDPIYRRLDASRLETRPMRFVGTPGSGQGIEEEINQSDNHFYPHVICPRCHKEAHLHPFGALLKSKTVTNETGEQETKYLSVTGKPSEWYHKDSSRPIETAYFACHHCGGELDLETRKQAFFKCLYTGVKLSDFLDNFENPNQKRIKAGISLSPLLRETKLNLAQDIIQSGLNTGNPNDWCQQRLGLPSQGENATLTINQIKKALFSPEPNPHKFQESFILAGIDQGRGNDFLIIIRYILPLRWEKFSFEEISTRTIRQCLFGGAVSRQEIPEIINNYDCEYTLIDNEPNITTAVELANQINGEIADQKPKQLDAIKESTVLDGGEEYACWGLRSSKFLRQVRNCFLENYTDGYPLARLPQAWEKWLSQPTEISPIRHLCSVSYNDANGEWERPADHNDDIYFAWMFSEAAFYLKMIEGGSYTAWFKYL